MIAAFPFHSRDIQKAVDLLEWIGVLGGCLNHTALLVSDCGVNWDDVLRIRTLAEKSFKKVWVTATPESIRAWPKGPNMMFRTAAECVENDLHEPFFFCETDCIPLCPGWLDTLDSLYQRSGKSFMGSLVISDSPGLPRVSLAGNAVYPADAASRLRLALDAQAGRAWDVASAQVAVPQSSDCRAIQHFWGQPQLPPTFAERKWPDSPINTFTLESLRSEAVVFHRNKDGTLMRLLRQKIYGIRLPAVIVTVPFCNKDSALALKHSRWLAQMCPQCGYEAVACMDQDTLGNSQSMIVEALRRSFSGVRTFRYRCGSTCSWPHGANIAFRNVAQHMQSLGHPWLWLEADAVATRRAWIDELQAAYEIAGKLFMGPIVPGMGHMNGVGIYPPDTPQYIPNALNNQNQAWAWDSLMKEEMIFACHNAEPLIQHVWGIVGGEVHPILGEAPNFDSQEKVKRWLKPEAVLFHRCKDGSLIDRLREIRK